MKTRKIATTLRRHIKALGRVDAAILLTWEDSPESSSLDPVQGVSLYRLNDWAKLLQIDAEKTLSPEIVKTVCRLLQPQSAVCLEGELRSFSDLVQLKLQSPKEERFHRVYYAIHATRKESVILHLYDLSASTDKKAREKAEREFDALRKLQLYPWVPRIIDSFQDARGFPGEMCFFTMADPSAPTLLERAQDKSWGVPQRIVFVREAIRALAQMHEQGIIHRNLTVSTIRVTYDAKPIFTGFQVARIPSDISVSSTSEMPEDWRDSAAPEVRKEGLAVADKRSDIYSLCCSLKILFGDSDDLIAKAAENVLSAGMKESPEERASLDDLEKEFGALQGESVPALTPPPAQYWSEGQEIEFRGNHYRIITRIGAGGVGTTFKIVHVDRKTKEEWGTYLAKVVHKKEHGEQLLTRYKMVRSHLGRQSRLSTIYEVEDEWKENNFLALMTWIDGTQLADFIGVFPLLAEEMHEENPEALAVRWLQNLCEALETLHSNGIIHNDISPRNIIISEEDVVLTDYDFVTKIGEPLTDPGTKTYCSPTYAHGGKASPADDFYALAASFFHVFFDCEPFLHDGNLRKDVGLNWKDINKAQYPILARFMDRATNPNAAQRIQSAKEALALLQFTSKDEEYGAMSEEVSSSPAVFLLSSRCAELKPESVKWVQQVLQSYPGSRLGNCETRGLDSSFAEKTYVETGLESVLEKDVRERRVRLIILCGNAGDGKTAMLQHVAERLGFGKRHSQERILKHEIPGGPTVEINLDGSAAWKGRSADEILDDFLEPFQNGLPGDDIVRILAINDGRLLEWLCRRDDTPLTKAISDLLEGNNSSETGHIRFIDLNNRSLVGGISDDGKEIQNRFVYELIDRLYGGENAREIWQPCVTCSAKTRCEIFRALKLFGPDNVPEKAEEKRRKRARERLVEALQAVHFRGEVHITARELRAALVFFLFGLHSCEEYQEAEPPRALPYWDLAFAPEAPGRQGDLLRELTRFDPALEAHPQIDRYLLGDPEDTFGRKAPRYGPEMSLASARRRAYFEWTEEDLEEFADDPYALGLARGKNLRIFRELALGSDNADICQKLCRGISRLEDLPPQALDRLDMHHVVPLRITPRTPTETTFWVEKDLNNFRLEVDLPPASEGLDRLHREVWLVYRYRDGKSEERLRLAADLFHLLLELAEGYQFGDVSSDDTFAQLSIFVQRLVREDEQTLYAWNPLEEDVLFRIATHLENDGQTTVQKLVLNRVQVERNEQ